MSIDVKTCTVSKARIFERQGTCPEHVRRVLATLNIAASGRQFWTHVRLALFVAAGISVLPLTVVGAESGLRNTQTERTVQFEFEVRNNTGRLVKDVEVGAFLPVKVAAGQRCCVVLADSGAGEVLSDPHGNQAMRFLLPHLPPYAVKTLRVRVALSAESAAMQEPYPPDNRWLGAEALVQVGHPKIREQSMRLTGKDAMSTARRIYRWVASSLEYAGYQRDARGALFALEQRRGDCTEYMHLFVALARANGIPARGMAGYVIGPDASSDTSVFHNWAEFYADGAWRIADAQRRVFDAGYGQYLTTRIMAGESGVFPPAAERFWSVGEGVQVRME